MPKASPANTVALRMIRAEYLKRRRKNPVYSLRAFGRDLAVAPSVLSEIFAEKRSLTDALLLRIAGGLNLNLVERRQMLRKTAPPAIPERGKYRKLHNEQFRLIAEWYHFAILNLTLTTGFESDPSWIGERLGITTAEAGEGIDRLLDLGLLRWKDGALVRTYKKLATETDKVSAALRLSHRQSLQHAVDCLDKVPVDLRDITSLTIPFDLAQMAVVKEKIYRFMTDITALTEAAPNKSDVFNLNVQFVPVTKPHRGKSRGEI